MQANTPPTKIPLAFANSGTKNPIPTASQIGITPGRASLETGFPPLTFTPVAAGGVPPFGADFNGILNLITEFQRWLSAGGSFTYDAAFAAAVGGYPKGARLIRADFAGFWVNAVDANSSNPDTGGAGWLNDRPSQLFGGRQEFTAPGTFVSPTDRIIVSACAGGGGAGGAPALTASQAVAGGGGGGAGQWILRREFIVTPGQSIAMAPGAAGIGGAIGAAGGNGGNTSIGSLITLNGGSGGNVSALATSGGFSAGARGGLGYPAGGDATDTSLDDAQGGSAGAGASGPFGFASGASRNNIGDLPTAPWIGRPGSGYGFGGSGCGGTYRGGSLGGTGSAGGAGYVLIEW